MSDQACSMNEWISAGKQSVLTRQLWNAVQMSIPPATKKCETRTCCVFSTLVSKEESGCSWVVVVHQKKWRRSGVCQSGVVLSHLSKKKNEFLMLVSPSGILVVFEEPWTTKHARL